MEVDFYASAPYLGDHMRGVHAGLPPERRGSFEVGRSVDWTMDRPGPAVVASYVDVGRLRAVTDRPIVMMRHGCGQSGTACLLSERPPPTDGIALHLAPNAEAAAEWKAASDVPVVAVGCPMLDPWLSGRPEVAHPSGLPVVAFTFTWDCTVVPEARSAWKAWCGRMALIGRQAQAQGWHPIGLAHPRWAGLLDKPFTAAGFEVAPDLGYVLDNADIMVGDNSSAMYEFACLDRPVVALNAKWYENTHGFRFWSHVPGPEVNTTGELLDVLDECLTGERPEWASLRRRAAVRAYGSSDGKAGLRAAEAILERF